MKVIIPNQVQQIINEMPFNQTVKKNAVKIYAAFWIKSNSKLKDKHGYFPVASTYLEAVNKRYSNIVKYFIEKGIVDFFKKPYIDENDIFNTKWRKSYNKHKGICAKYKFLIDVYNGDEIDVDLLCNKQFRWYDVLQNSLIECGFEPKIKRDNYGRRVFHPAIKNYKEDFKGYYVIDAVCSQPRLLYLYMKELNIKDPNSNFIDPAYSSIFENDLDFYDVISDKLDLDCRDDAKDLFMHWLNGDGYVPNFKIHMLFPVVSKFLKSIKRGNYKESGSLLQRIESKIWIDDILNNIPCGFALSIHDSVIVNKEDSKIVLDYCERKYPELKFSMKKIK